MDPQLEQATNEMQEATTALRTSMSAAEAQLKSVGGDVKSVAQDVSRMEGVSGELKERIAKAEEGVQKYEDKWREIDAAIKASNEAAEANGLALKESDRLRGELETKFDLLKRHRPAAADEDEEKAQERLYEKAFSKALRGGLGDGNRERPHLKHKLTETEQKAIDDVEEKSLSADGGESGGYLMPPAARGALIKKLIELDPLEELSSSVNLTSGDTWEAPREGDQNFACNWTSERGDRAETDAAQLAKETIVAQEMYAKPLITQKMLDDPGFDVPGWLTERLAKRMAVKRGQGFITGTGNGQPEGITVSPTAIGTGSFGYVAMGDASTIADGDGLWDIFIDLPEVYSSTSTWLWKRATTGIIRKLKDGNDNYIWAPAFEGIPPAVCDRPYRESISMPAVAANAFSVALGDWTSAYLVVRRQEIRVLRDPYSSKPFVEFYTTSRVGGAPVLNEAYRLGKIATS